MSTTCGAVYRTTCCCTLGAGGDSDPLGLVAVVALEPGPEHVPYLGGHAWALALGELRDPFQHPDVVLVPPRVAAVTWRLSVEVQVDQREPHARHAVRIIRKKLRQQRVTALLPRPGQNMKRYHTLRLN